MTHAATDSPTTKAADAVVSVRDLEVQFETPIGLVRALNGVTFDVPRGQVLGIVGESGCGKSVTARAIMQIIEKSGKIVNGTIELNRPDTATSDDAVASQILADDDADAETTRAIKAGRVEITSLKPNSAGMRAIRGKEIAMIFQEPMSSLNPVYTVGSQIEEAILLHQTQDKQEAARRAVDMLRQVGMPNPEGAAKAFPHQLSGGMRQRAMIAMALSCTPTLLIADEPTTALDVTTEAQILELMRKLKEDIGMSIMFITHSMGVVAQLCDEVIVMYLGQVVERASVDEIFYHPKHPYTQSLLRSIPRIGSDRKVPLEVIKGSVPDPYSRVSGCPFHPRCPEFMAGRCDTKVPVEISMDDDPTHTVRCHLYYDDDQVPAKTASEA
jgi:oligopeptide/dipeptide ABC transporter ATP-binding protein